MRRFFKNDHANLDMILGAVVVMVMLAISIVIVWNVVGAIDASSLDTAVDAVYNDPGAASTLVTNSTSDLTDNMNTFYQVSPIVLIVMAAVGILGYVLLLRKRE